eukprot:CAMPEP_0171092568 /NCGR_PEP_ID=MMETSP0766_2-20121228/36171_1 /TAXON_ID=439317 /ORGANISM="Gambierdiscus australes, Strain CAWD 149" /LENGTH=56 /DNA_ID=CAMNT_0011550835 /DNA_START=297 /DNA_END=467 /DNA_ORIENTATION=-
MPSPNQLALVFALAHGLEAEMTEIAVEPFVAEATLEMASMAAVGVVLAAIVFTQKS